MTGCWALLPATARAVRLEVLVRFSGYSGFYINLYIYTHIYIYIYIYIMYIYIERERGGFRV